MTPPRNCLLLAALAGTVPAQMSGNVVVDPAGGSNTFRSITAAVNAMFVYGISAPVEVLIAPGTYTETVVVWPIPGLSMMQTVTLRSREGPGTVSLHGSSADVFAMIATGSTHLSGIVFDGLDFVGGPRHAIMGGPSVEGVVIKNCTFASGFGSHQIAPGVPLAGSISWSPTQPGWVIEGCRFARSASPTGSMCIATSIVPCEIHHNTFQLQDVGLCIQLANASRVYDNLFRGSLVRTASMNAAVISAEENIRATEVVCNTFDIDIPGNGCCLALLEWGIAAPSFLFRGNLFRVTGGSCIVVRNYSFGPSRFVSDRNLFWTQGAIGRIETTPPTVCASLAAWRTATGQDTTSIAADPRFTRYTAAAPRSDTTGPDLHPASDSPARDAAGTIPGYVTTDFDGRSRGALPDIGAYEGTNLSIFGDGCTGTGNVVPTIAGSGVAAIGSTSFAVELSNARPGALAMLVIGGSRTSHGAVALPLALGACALLVSPDATSSLPTAAAGTATAPLAIPNNGALRGTDVHFQWLVADPAGRGGGGFAMTNGGTLEL